MAHNVPMPWAIGSFACFAFRNNLLHVATRTINILPDFSNITSVIEVNQFL